MADPEPLNVALGLAADPRPRAEPALRELPLGLRDLLDHRVVLGQAQGAVLLIVAMITVAREARVERLRQARTADSKAKTKRGLDAVASLVAAGERITVARVARKAAVSTWFVYNSPDVHQAVRAAVQEQAWHGIPAAAILPRQRVSEASLQTDLALAREEIKGL
ncbi:DUF6262 family protein (plasmid) [Streptomyces sp. NBC_00257]|uniref:DUF6262 family protein n=2 Tax=unclassified Streptomyces TaxID=2593676 RepID=UPI002258C145|nr:MULTISPECIES: DUF6262 family protein [unclassified Streptomyces]MCX5434564.1 DUF6262 family protein [Streptomyces sp. NBC_00062]